MKDIDGVMDGVNDGVEVKKCVYSMNYSHLIENPHNRQTPHITQNGTHGCVCMYIT